jgi:hypothetical protein
MKAKRLQCGGIVLICTAFLFVVASTLRCQTPNTENTGAQNPIICYSLVPGILLQNIVLSASGSTNNSTTLISVACEITILRPSIRD